MSPALSRPKISDFIDFPFIQKSDTAISALIFCFSRQIDKYDFTDSSKTEINYFEMGTAHEKFLGDFKSIWTEKCEYYDEKFRLE